MAGREISKGRRITVWVDPKGNFTSDGVLYKLGSGATVERSDRARKPRARLTAGSVYFGSSDAYSVMTAFAAYAKFMDVIGFDEIEIASVEPGSVLVKLKQLTTRIIERRKLRVFATQLLGAAEGFTAEKFQAENTSKHATSVADLADKTKHLKSFSFDSGPLQYVQYQDDKGNMHGRARVLGSKDVASNRLSDEILSNPEQMYNELEGQQGTIDPPADQP